MIKELYSFDLYNLKVTIFTFIIGAFCPFLQCFRACMHIVASVEFYVVTLKALYASTGGV